MKLAFKNYYKKSRQERLDILESHSTLTKEQLIILKSSPKLTDEVADSLIENQISQFVLPEGLALNFKINDQNVLVPMVTEEPSVIAAASHAAKIFSQAGFRTHSKIKGMIGQIILPNVEDPESLRNEIQAHEAEFFNLAAESHPSIVKRGGGLREIEYRIIPDTVNQTSFLTLHFIVDTLDAMGANIVNTILEGIKPLIEKLTNIKPLMTILSNYNTESLSTATCRIKVSDIPNKTQLSNKQLAERIVAANHYAKLDPYRAATHNKGIMNGIDAVIIATGNDPRAVEAGVHAYACRKGQYQGLTDWQLVDDELRGELTLPLALGTIGGAISVLPHAKVNLDLLEVRHADELAEIIVAVGLAQNFAALKALVSEGIQKGHMNLHASSLAIQVGAKGEEIEKLTALLQQEPKMNSEIALKLLKSIQK